MEFHNKIMWNSRIVCKKKKWNSTIFFGCAHGESKLRDNSTRARVQTSRERYFGKTRNETTKNRTQHDQGSLNKQSACSINYLASALAPYQRSRQEIIFLDVLQKNYPSLVSRNCLERSNCWNTTPIAAI